MSLSASFKFCKRFQNDKGVCITSIRRDQGGEFENENFQLFYDENVILNNFSTPRTSIEWNSWKKKHIFARDGQHHAQW